MKRSFVSLFCLLSAGTSLFAQSPQAPQTPPPESPAPAPAAAPANWVENSVVKIFSTMRLPDPAKPWTKQVPRDVTGTGVVIEGKRILTNAHVALYASQVQIQANQSGDKLAATVEFVAPGIDLAVLKLEDESFFDTHPALSRAPKLPSVKDAVMVYGFPTGGTSLSITKGIVSRIEFTGYNYPMSGLRIQIDAAINPGNSGGPALADDRMIGLAFSRLGGADNIGYIIPCEEIEIFLQDVKDGRYDGKPAQHDAMQSFENPALRGYLKPGKGVEGLIVSEVDSTDPTYPLKQWDIVSQIGGVPIDNEGMVKVGDNLRVRFGYHVQHFAKNGTVPLTIVRGGKSLEIQLPLVTRRPLLIADLEGDYPPYFICGPVVFSVATSHFVGPLNGNANALAVLIGLANPLALRRTEKPAFPGEQLVFISSPLFPHKLIKGYDNPFARVIESVNGIKVKNLGHLVTILRDARDEFIILEFSGKGAETMVFPRKELVDSTEDILNDNGVRAQGSPDMLEIWNAKPAK